MLISISFVTCNTMIVIGEGITDGEEKREIKKLTSRQLLHMKVKSTRIMLGQLNRLHLFVHEHEELSPMCKV